MNENLYLDDHRREFYSSALDLIRSCDSEFWSLDRDLDEYIDRINRNSNVRTMYSRNGSAHMNDLLGSYLTICYSENLEPNILNSLVPALKSKFLELEELELGELEFEYTLNEPYKQDSDKDVHPYLKYINHADYWNVYHIRFELRSYFSDHHKFFWDYLSSKLSKL